MVVFVFVLPTEASPFSTDGWLAEPTVHKPTAPRLPSVPRSTSAPADFLSSQALLGHPLCLTLLHFKWHRLARYLYYINLLLYITFLTFLTGYLISTPPPNAYADKLA